MDTDVRLPQPVAGNLRIHKAYAPPERWLMIADRAKKAGMSVSSYLNALVDRDVLDGDGCPVWAKTPGSTQTTLADLEDAA